MFKEIQPIQASALVIVGLILSMLAPGCTSPPPPMLKQPLSVSRPATADTSYCAQVVAQLIRDGIETSPVDFTRFRQSCFANRREEGDRHIERDIGVALKEKRCADVVALAEIVLKSRYGTIRTHVQKAYCHKKMREMESYRAHMFLASGMIHSIIDGRTGRSLDDAYEVYTIDNEYGVMEYLELTLKQQTLVTRGERSYDRMDCVDTEGREVSVYFDVSAHMRSLSDKLGA